MVIPYKIQLARIHRSLALIVLVDGISTNAMLKNEQIFITNVLKNILDICSQMAFQITANVLKNKNRSKTNEQILHRQDTVQR